jgi:hypothetical protein
MQLLHMWVLASKNRKCNPSSVENKDSHRNHLCMVANPLDPVLEFKRLTVCLLMAVAQACSQSCSLSHHQKETVAHPCE